MITKETIDCYRVNYNKKGWMKYSDPRGWIILPDGILIALELLCDEVERLNGWKKK